MVNENENATLFRVAFLHDLTKRGKLCYVIISITIKITYGVTEGIYCLEGERRVSYGIAAYSDVKRNGTDIIVASVHDITSEKERLSKLVDDCNRLQLSSSHLSDVVEDFLLK